jgi:hypothetical protein
MAAVVAMGMAGSAVASDTDTFTVSGTGPEGNTYTGTVALTELQLGSAVKGDVFKVVWTIGGATTEGVSIVSETNRQVLSIGYSHQGKTGVAVMTEADGKASGSWWIDGAPGTGTEVWTPAQ